MNKGFKETVKFFKKNNQLIILTIIPVVFFCLLVIIIGILSPKPNDNISPSNRGYLFENRNPNFNVGFGNPEDPDQSYVRFEAVIGDNPFEQKEGNLLDTVAQKFSSKKGFEFGLSEVRFSETDSEFSKKLIEQIGSAIEQMEKDEISTDTEVIEVGRLLGEKDENNVSKKTVINKDVYPGIDIEYQILEDLGVKEEIIIRDIQEYTTNCGQDRECLLPLNEFVFDLKLDEGLKIEETMAKFRDKVENKYYITDSENNYIAHFLPTFAIDSSGAKTTDVNLDINQIEGNNYEVVVTLNLDWLFSNERSFPVRIDPSIVHDTTTEFDTGSNYNTEVVTGPKLKIQEQEVFNVDENVLGYWKLNESSGSGAYILDSTGNGYDGTPTNTTFTEGKFRGGREFTTTVNKITIGDIAAFEEDIFTIDAYIKRTGTCNFGYCTIFSKGSTSNEGYSFGVIHQSTDPVLHVRINDGGSGNTQHFTGSTVIETGKWYHVAAVVNSTTDTFKLYVNGKIEPSTGSFTETISYGLAEIKIGNGNSGDDIGFNGVIDEVRFSKVERTPEEISNYYLSRSSGYHTSTELDFGQTGDLESISWTPVGSNTGDAETPYSTTGLVAQWDFNESSGTTADNEGSCGSTCDGTLSSFSDTTGQDVALGSGWTSDNRRWGAGSLMFDGTDDYVQSSSTSDLRPANDFSIETWVKIDTIGNLHGIIYHDNHHGGDDGWGLRIQDTGKAAFFALNSNGWYAQNVESNTVLETDRWYYLVGMYDSSVLKIYVNGVLDNSKNASGDVVYDNTNYITIGKRGGTYEPNTQYLNGTIDSLRFYNRVLTDTEILSNYQSGNIEMRYRTSADGSTWTEWSGTETSVENFDDEYQYSTSVTGFLSYWPMEESSGTNVEDLGYTNDGTADGANISDGKFGNARTFDGVNDYIQVPDNLSLRMASGLTVEMWYKTTEVPATWTVPVRKDTETGTRYLYGLAFDSDSGGRIFGQYYNGGNHLATYSDPEVFDGNWHHAVMTISGTTQKFYFDGVLKDTNTITGTQGVPTGELNIGAAPPWTGGSRAGFFEGSIDEVRISNTVSTEAEVYERWVKGSSNATTLRAKPSDNNVEGTGALEIESTGNTVDANTVGYWTLDEASGTGSYINDESPNGNDGTPSGTTYIKNGRVNGARDFDGTNDKITVGTTGRPTNSFTVETWFTTDVTHQIDTESTSGTSGTSGQRYLFGAADGSSNAGMGVSVGTNGISVYEHGSSYMPAIAVYSGTIPDGWNHLAVVYNNKTPSIYLNGMLVHTGLTSTKTTVYAPYEIGGGSYGYHSGMVDDVRISNRVRSSEEIGLIYSMGQGEYVNVDISNSNISNNTVIPFWIASDQLGNNMELIYGESKFANYESDDNTAGLWHLDEDYSIASSYFLEDSSGNGNDGDPDGSAYNKPYPKGARGLSRSFDGTGGVIKLGNPSSLQITGSQTIDMWLYPNDFSARRNPYAKAYGGEGTITQETNGTLNYYYGTAGGNATPYQNFNSNKSLNINSWNHIAIVRDLTAMKLYWYIDGKLTNTTTASYASATASTLEAFIGNGYTTFYSGYIDEVRISNTARSADEIRQTYEVGKRTHSIKVNFKADLESSNLISSSLDTSFTISEENYGTSNPIENIDVNEKIIVKEKVGTTEYFAQADLATVNTGTGAVTVSSWDSGSTFPTSGYTTNATVFKWQREYIDVRYPLEEDINAINTLTFRKTTNSPASFLIDDAKSATYSSDYGASSFTMVEDVQYVQYQPIFSKWDKNAYLALYLSEVQVDYFTGPTMEQLMRHGKWFDSSGQEQPFWWADGVVEESTWTLNFSNIYACPATSGESNTETFPEGGIYYLSNSISSGSNTVEVSIDGAAYEYWSSGGTKTIKINDTVKFKVSLLMSDETQGTLTIREDDASGRIIDTIDYWIDSGPTCPF